MKKLLAAARRFRPGHKYGPLRCDRWWPALLHVAYDCALRRSSLLAIRQDHIDLAGRWLLVEGDTTKTLKGQSFKLSDDTVAALREIWEPARERIFEFVAARTIDKQFDLLLEAADVRRCRRKGLNKFHMLRRTTATLIAAPAGILAASAMLGHSSAEVTRRHYADPTQIKHDAASVLPLLSAG